MLRMTHISLPVLGQASAVRGVMQPVLCECVCVCVCVCRGQGPSRTDAAEG